MKIIFGLTLLLYDTLVNVNAGSVCTNLLEKLDQVVAKNSQLEEKNNRLEEKINKLETSRCAFSAQGSTVHTVRTDDSPIPFPTVNLNTCGGYDAKSGVFTATKAGTYEFNMYLRSEGTDRGSIYMWKNSEWICSAWIDDVKKGESTGPRRRDMAACSVVTKLVPGDKVKVTGESANPGKITGNKRGFSGFLIYPA